MLLEQNFYSIIEFVDSEGVINAQIELNPNHEIFKGHFPNQPIVPGVCMIQIIKELFATNRSQNYSLLKSSQIKFLKLLIPKEKETVRVSITHSKQNDNGYLINATISNSDGVILKLSNGLLA